MAKVTNQLQHELDLLRATACVLSTNVELRLDGQPKSNRALCPDSGAAVYFKLKGRDISLACDKWDRVECNVWAIAKHIEALRGQERWGIGTVEQAFTGYLALPAPMDLEPWWEVLDCKEGDDKATVEKRYHYLAKVNHPDNGGGNDAMTRINSAWASAKFARGW